MAMNDEMIALLRESDEGVSSAALAERFLKFRSPVERLAHVAVEAILGKDQRCRFGEDDLWHAGPVAQPDQAMPLAETPWAAVSALHHGRDLVHVSIWTVLQIGRASCRERV